MPCAPLTGGQDGAATLRGPRDARWEAPTGPGVRPGAQGCKWGLGQVCVHRGYSALCTVDTRRTGEHTKKTRSGTQRDVIRP